MDLAGGFAPVYFLSLGFVFIGMFYIWIIPESVTKRGQVEEEEEVDMNQNEMEKTDVKPAKKKSFWTHFLETNKLFLETIRFIFRCIQRVEMDPYNNKNILFLATESTGSATSSWACCCSASSP